jgi:serine protease AprX
VRLNRIYQKILSVLFVLATAGVFVLQADAAVLSPKLRSDLNSLAESTNLGLTVVAFNTSNGLQTSHLNILRSVGITGGQTFPTLGMVAMPMTVAQVRALRNNPSIRSIWSNDRLFYYMNQARTLTGVDRIRTDAPYTLRNGGMPVSGSGDFSVLVIDSGVDATHTDLAYGTKVIQNVQTVVAAGTLEGFTSNVAIEGVPNTDQSVGHGTHCAGIIGGLGVRSGGTYAGVAPGAKIIGAGLGAGIFVINGLAAWEWGLANQYRYNIRVVSNSYGGAGAFDVGDPIMIASKMAYERNITVLFAGGNDGAAKGTLSSYAKAPWVIGVAAGTKEGTLADFSSRGIPRAERLADNDPLNDNDAPTITAPGTGRAFEVNAGRFSAAIAAVRSTSNLVANGGADDTELPLAMIPFYTQISGTSMATPFVAGTVALMLDADPTLNPDEVKQIITETASRMPGYEDYEVGAGYLNAYAAVDKVFNRSKNYRNRQEVSFNAVFGEERPAAQDFHIAFNPAVSGATSQNAAAFTVEPGMNVLEVSAVVDTDLGEGTGNLVGIRLTAPDGTGYSTAIDFPVIGTDRREIVVDNPASGTWTLEVRGARSLAAVPQASLPTQAALPGPVDGTVKQVKYVLPQIEDLNGHPQRATIETALKSRLIDTFSNGKFYPDNFVTRGELAQSMALNSALRQTVGATPKFTDVSGDPAKIAEAVTARGATLRDYDFAPTGLLSFSGTSFSPNANASRLDAAVAFVKALGHDAEARALANTNVTFNGTVLSDNAQIPGALRGYVQLALANGLFEAYPAEVVQIAPGQYQVLPGPRFEPAGTLARSNFAAKLIRFNQLFTTGG